MNLSAGRVASGARPRVSVSRNSAFGLLGFLVPTAIIFAAYPVLVKGLGLEALGVYFLATSVSGALAFLDVGFSAATVKFVAEDLAEGKLQDASDVIGASILFYSGLGLFCAGVLWLLSPLLVNSYFKVNPALHDAAILSFRLAALQFAAFLSTTVFISIFKGMQKFHLSAVILSLLSIGTYGGAVAVVLFFHGGLAEVTLASLLANVAVLAVSVVLSLQLCHSVGIHLSAARPKWVTFKRMFSFGSLMTLNQISALCLNQVQKFLIGAWLSPAAVTIWQTATMPPSKVHAAVNSFTEVMFPMSSAIKDRDRLRSIYRKMLGGSLLLALAAFGPFLLLQKYLIGFWMRGADPEQVTKLIPTLVVAYFFLALSPAPYHLLNGIGKPWVNTIFATVNAVVNILCIALFRIQGISLIQFAWALAIANSVTSIGYQLTVEFYVWRKLMTDETVPAKIYL